MDSIKLTSLLERAKTVKKDFEESAELARKIYANDNIQDVVSKEPTANWNFFRTAVQNILARITSNDPRPRIGARSVGDSEFAEAFQSRLEAHLSKSSFTPVLRNALQDMLICGNGFLYVTPDAKVEYLNYFDVYVDNALATNGDISNGRYVFIRRLMDEAEFEATFGEYLPDNLETEGASVPGRSLVGDRAAQSRYEYKQNSTAIWLPPSKSGLMGADKTNITEDGLVEYWEVYTLNPDSESNWTQYHLYGDTVLGEGINLPSFLDGPPVVALSVDSISGQFYQPSQWLYLQETQDAVNHISNKTLRNISLIDFPPLISTKGSNLSMYGPNGVKLHNYYRFAPGDHYTVDNKGDIPTTMELPTVPDQYFKFREMLKGDLREETGIHEASEGKEPSSNTSGIALQTLSHNTNIRVGLLDTNIMEALKDVARIMSLIILINDSGLEVDPEQIQNDYFFEFKITPPITKEQRVDQMIKAIGVLQPLVQDVELAIKLSASLTENNDIGEDIIDVIQAHAMKAQEPQTQEVPQEIPVSPEETLAEPESQYAEQQEIISQEQFESLTPEQQAQLLEMDAMQRRSM